MSEHTHILAKPHGLIVDGVRTKAPAGTPCSPTDAQLRNMPDVFVSVDGHQVEAAPTGHGIKGHSVGKIKEMVELVDDPTALDEMHAEEEAGRNRKGALEAISKRLAELADDDGDDEEEEG